MVKMAKKIVKMAKKVKIAKNGLNCSKRVPNGQKWSKMAGLTLSRPNVPA